MKRYICVSYISYTLCSYVISYLNTTPRVVTYMLCVISRLVYIRKNFVILPCENHGKTFHFHCSVVQLWWYIVPNYAFLMLQYVASGSDDFRVYLWKIPEGTCTYPQILQLPRVYVLFQIWRLCSWATSTVVWYHLHILFFPGTALSPTRYATLPLTISSAPRALRR